MEKVIIMVFTTLNIIHKTITTTTIINTLTVVQAAKLFQQFNILEKEVFSEEPKEQYYNHNLKEKR